jgi:hypothetical protein
LLAPYKQRGKGETFAGIRTACALLASPSSSSASSGILERGTGHGLASATSISHRLLFFLWSSIPDDELLDVASRGKLRSALSIRNGECSRIPL